MLRRAYLVSASEAPVEILGMYSFDLKSAHWLSEQICPLVIEIL